MIQSIIIIDIIASYLSDRWQHVKINGTFSTWSALEQGVPQGSVLGPVLFSIYLTDLYFTLSSVNVCNFADDTTPFLCDLNLEVYIYIYMRKVLRDFPSIIDS